MFQSIGLLVLLLILQALLTIAETAVLEAGQNKIKKKAEEGDKKAVRLREVMENPSGFLTAVRICSTFIWLLSGAVAALVFAERLTSFIINAGVSIPPIVILSLSALVVLIIVSYFFLVFGELTPRHIAVKKADQIVYTIAVPIIFFSRLARPFIRLVSASARFVMRLTGVDAAEDDDDVTEEEIRMLVDAGGETGSIDENEMEMINNIFEFDDKTAGDICTHRTDIIAIPSDAEEQEILSLLTREKFSRIPVFEENIDNIVGVLHIRDVLKYIINDTLHEEKLNLIMRKPYFVPFSKKTDELFEEMQKNKLHMAIVVDEYGGTLGLVTMEDLIEEIMGNIFDEYDEEQEPNINHIDKNTYLINGSTELSEVSEFLDVDLPDDYDTLSGFLVGQIGRIPEEGEQPELEWGGLLFKVYKVEEKRIASAIVCKL